MKVAVLQPTGGGFLDGPILKVRLGQAAPGWSEDPFSSLSGIEFDPSSEEFIRWFGEERISYLPSEIRIRSAWVDRLDASWILPPSCVSTSYYLYREPVTTFVALQRFEQTLSAPFTKQTSHLTRQDLIELFCSDSPVVDITCWLQLAEIYLRRRTSYPDRQFHSVDTAFGMVLFEHTHEELDTRQPTCPKIGHVFGPTLQTSDPRGICKFILSHEGRNDTGLLKRIPHFDSEVWIWT
jgi:hypothetical protein